MPHAQQILVQHNDFAIHFLSLRRVRVKDALRLLRRELDAKVFRGEPAVLARVGDGRNLERGRGAEPLGAAAPAQLAAQKRE